jgi:hypothetical protein
MSVSYGIDVLPKNDPYIGTAETAFHGLVVASMPGAFLVDSIPALKVCALDYLIMNDPYNNLVRS